MTMHRAIFIALALCLLARPAVALCDGWIASNTATAGAFTVLALIDWHQTREFTARQPTQTPRGKTSPQTENNRFLGPRPSPAAVNRYMAGSIALTWALGCYLPNPWRDIAFGGLALDRLVVVIQNQMLGVRLDF